MSAPATAARLFAICVVVCLVAAPAASGSPLSQDPQQAETVYSQAEAALLAGDAEAALQMWNSILRQYPRSRFPDLLWRAAAATRAGEVEVRLGRADEAAAYFVAVLDGEEPSIWTERARLGMATTLMWRDEWPAAFRLLQSIVSAVETDRPGSDPIAARMAGELLSLGHRLWIRPAAGQQPWSTTGRWAPTGALDKPIGVASGGTTEVTVVDEGLGTVLLVSGGGTPATFAAPDAVRPWRSPAGRGYLAAKGAVTAPLFAESFEFSVPDGSRLRPLGDIRAGASSGAGDWILLDGRLKQVLLFTSDGRYQESLDLGPDGEPVDVARGAQPPVVFDKPVGAVGDAVLHRRLPRCHRHTQRYAGDFARIQRVAAARQLLRVRVPIAIIVGIDIVPQTVVVRIEQEQIHPVVDTIGVIIRINRIVRKMFVID